MFRPLHIWLPSISSELPTAVEGWCAHSRHSADNHRTAINSAYNSSVLKPLWNLQRKGWTAFQPTLIECLTLACTSPRKTPGSSVSITSHQGHACGSHRRGWEHQSSQTLLLGLRSHATLENIQGNTLPFYEEWGIFYVLIKDLWHPRWEMGVIGKLCYSVHRSRPSGTLKIQRVHIPLSQPLGIDTVEEVVQSSSKVLTSFISPFLDPSSPSHSLVAQFTLTTKYRFTKKVTVHLLCDQDTVIQSPYTGKTEAHFYTKACRSQAIQMLS